MKFFFTGPVCPAGTALALRQRQRYRFLIFLMRVSCTYIVLMILSLQVLLANKGRGQNLDQIKVTIGLQNENLKTLFDQIEVQTGLSFAFTPVDIEGAPMVSLPRATRSVKSTLDLALVGTYLRYEQVNQNVIVSKGELNVVEGPYVAFSIRGKVTNNQGEVMPGVSIYVKGTTRGTTTDGEGIYVISAEANDVLVFSFVGFKTQEVNVDARGVIDVGMEDDAATLGEVVVKAGYYDVKQREMPGNISRITLEDITKQPISNPLQAMQGRMPGVYIQQASGVPGSSFVVQIRGKNSLRYDGNEPLYVVDGVPFTSSTLSSPYAAGGIIAASPLNNINPTDIESIEVLKDADATAIYGSRGSNGVILITTKKGKTGKTKFDINVYSGIGNVSRKMNLLNTAQYLDMRKEALDNDDYTQYLLPKFANFFPDLLIWDTTRYIDWQKKLIGGTAHITNVQGNLSGGNENTQFLVGGGLYKEGTVFPGDFADTKASVHLNVNHNSENQKFKTSFSVSFVSDDNDLPQTDLTPQALALPPNAPELYNEDGLLNWENDTWKNPLQQIVCKYKSNTDNIIANSSMSYEIFPKLKLKNSVGYTKIQRNEISLTPIASLNPYDNITTGSSISATQTVNTWIIEPQIEYEKKINLGTLNMLIGSTFQENKKRSQTISASGFTSDALLEDIMAAPAISPLNSDYSLYRYNALFGRINYNWAGKYILNLTGRRDGSSRFGPDKRFSNFGALGAAWILHKESFMKSLSSFISYTKLRASYGVTGSDQIGDYKYLDTYITTPYPYQGIGGLVPTQLVNPDFAWEKNKKFEAGLELGALNDRIFLSISRYVSRSSNQLVGYSLPPTTGFASVQYNLPATVENTGWEVELNVTPIQTTNFSWTVSANATAPKNKLIKYPNLEGSPDATTYSIGKSLFIYKAIHSTGVDPETGIYTFEDVNDNGSSIDIPDDLQAIKEISQKYYGGLNNRITFHGLQLDIFIQFVKQTGRNYLTLFGSPPGHPTNQPTIIMNRWRRPGDITNIQAFTQLSSNDLYNNYSNTRYYSDNVVSDASFIRIKNISLSWQVPSAFSKKMHLQNSRIYVQGQNLLTITNYNGLDPESQGATLPPLRVVTLGIQLTL